MLKLDNLSAGYRPFRIVKNISLEIRRGEVVSIIGPNGAGKTTLLRSIVGLADVLGGAVYINGHDVTDMQTEEIARQGIILVPDDRRLFPNMTCEENLELGAYLENAKKRIYDSLELVYTLFPILKEKRRQLAKTLSGGEQQMLAIARGLMASPMVLLVDEPSTGLSPKLVSSILQTFRELGEKGLAVLFTEQNIYAAIEYSTRTYLLTRGEVMLSGSSWEILNTADLIDKYFR